MEETVPIPPGFVIVNVVPWKSVGSNLPLLDLPIKLLYSLLNSLKFITPAFLIFGTINERVPSLLVISTAIPKLI